MSTEISWSRKVPTESPQGRDNRACVSDAATEKRPGRSLFQGPRSWQDSDGWDG